MTTLATYLDQKRCLVEERLDSCLRSAEVPLPLLDAMRYSLLAPGKRLRPCLVYLACEVAGGADTDAWPAACAVEMVHTYSLIHDDLPAMDDDDLRRGLPTCHKKFGEALAILAGDALLTLAFEVLAAHYPPPVAAACCLDLARGAGAAGMVGGQVEDLGWERSSGAGQDPLFPRTEQPHTLEALESIHAHKTGALFRACLRLGAHAGAGSRGADPDLIRRLDGYGHCFGLVFQITDDLLDVEGSAAETGKRTQKDAGRGKLTYPGLLGIEESRRHARDLTDQAAELLRPLAATPRAGDAERASGAAAGQFLTELMQFVLARNR